MKFINKNEAPKEYLDWIENFIKNNKKSPNYVDIPQKYKILLKEQFIKEQMGLCCYCCGRLDYDQSHIEHYYPRNLCKIKNRKKQTDYNNMFASCNGYIEGISEFDKDFCGHRKKEWYEENKMISPLDKNCSNYFEYTSQGKIKAKSFDIKAEAMIKELGLDEYALIEGRKKALEAIGYYDENFDKEFALKLSKEKDEKGYLPSFCNIIEYFASK